MRGPRPRTFWRIRHELAQRNRKRTDGEAFRRQENPRIPAGRHGHGERQDRRRRAQRVQAYEGVCIGRAGAGINENFTVRKISYGEGVERVFPLYSPLINSIEVVRRGKVRRAKLYYLRGRRGKSARIAERQDHTAEAAEDKKAAK